MHGSEALWPPHSIRSPSVSGGLSAISEPAEHPDNPCVLKQATAWMRVFTVNASIQNGELLWML